MTQPASFDTQFYKKALDNARQGVWNIGEDDDRLYLSDAWFEIRGLAPPETHSFSKAHWETHLHPEDRDRVLEQNRLLGAGVIPEANYAYRQRHAQGHWIWIMSRGSAVAWDVTGKPTRFAGTDTDITAIKATEEHLTRTQRRLELALSSIQAGVWRFQVLDNQVDWEPCLRAIYGLPPDDRPLPNDIWERALHPDDRDAAIALARDALFRKSDYEMHYRIIRPDGAIRFIRSKVSYLEESTEGPQLVGLDFDITEEHETAEALRLAKELAEQRNVDLESARADMEHQAMHDVLTGLPNRRFLELIQGQPVQSAQDAPPPRSAMFLMDLDRLKQINDVFGHDAGDHVLRQMAHLLRTCGVDGAFPARIGGDEFALFMRDAPDDEGLVRIAQDLIAKASEPSYYGQVECRVALSVGISRSADHPIDSKRLFIEADIALYRAKKADRQRFVFFSESQRDAVEVLKRRTDALMAAIERRDFICHYQPQFDARNGKVSGVEALVRWPQPDGSLLLPGDFLPIAHEIGVLASIDRIVLDKALADFALWKGQGLILPRLSVNFSAARLGELGLAEELARLGPDRTALSFELLETTLLEELGSAIAGNLEAIRALGIGIEVDDFGTGHASLFSLLRLKPDRLKIDRRLVELAVDSATNEQVLSSIIEIGHFLGISIVAEGVETEHQRSRLTALGCDFLQGYGLAPPMSSANLVKFLTAHLAA